MRRILLVLFLVSVMLVASIGTAKAESILFPYIANTTGNLDTIITVINTAGSSVANQLYYQYWTKAAGVTNENVNACNAYSFYRPTTTNDIVTFAAGGNSPLGGGNAMFGDATSYAVGVGAPNFAHGHGSGRFGYLVVALYNAGTTFISAANNQLLDGEASLYDIATGAMWGYRAVPSNVEAAAGTLTTNSYTFRGSVSALSAAVEVPAMPKISVYPPNQFTGRLFVTPLLGASNNMLTDDNKITNVGLIFATGRPGMFDRNEASVDSGGPIAVRCVARIDVTNLVGGAIGPLSSTGMLYTQGGWAYVDLIDSAIVGDAIVYDLKFGNVTGMSGMVNDGKLLLDWAAR